MAEPTDHTTHAGQQRAAVAAAASRSAALAPRTSALSAAGSPQSTRHTLAQLTERFRLSKTTLRLIAQAEDPLLGDSDIPDERTIAKVAEAIEVLVLAGLDSDQLIAGAIAEHRQRGGENWRQGLWSELLTAASEEWDRRGRPEPPLGPWLVTVPPIPPQPTEEITGGDHHGHGLAA